jgi:hypothetical protein
LLPDLDDEALVEEHRVRAHRLGAGHSSVVQMSTSPRVSTKYPALRYLVLILR